MENDSDGEVWSPQLSRPGRLLPRTFRGPVTLIAGAGRTWDASPETPETRHGAPLSRSSRAGRLALGRSRGRANGSRRRLSSGSPREGPHPCFSAPDPALPRPERLRAVVTHRGVSRTFTIPPGPSEGGSRSGGSRLGGRVQAVRTPRGGRTPGVSPVCGWKPLSWTPVSPAGGAGTRRVRGRRSSGRGPPRRRLPPSPVSLRPLVPPPPTSGAAATQEGGSEGREVPEGSGSTRRRGLSAVSSVVVGSEGSPPTVGGGTPKGEVSKVSLGSESRATRVTSRPVSRPTGGPQVQSAPLVWVARLPRPREPPRKPFPT